MDHDCVGGCASPYDPNQIEEKHLANYYYFPLSKKATGSMSRFSSCHSNGG